MQDVKNILDQLLQPSPKQEAWKLNLIKNWPLVVGSLHEKVSLQKIQRNSIVLGVYDQSWMQELYLLSKLILKKINTHLGQPRIETLRFQCIEKKSQTSKKISLPKLQKKHIILTYDQKKALLKITDQELSQALQEFLQKCQE